MKVFEVFDDTSRKLSSKWKISVLFSMLYFTLYFREIKSDTISAHEGKSQLLKRMVDSIAGNDVYSKDSAEQSLNHVVNAECVTKSSIVQQSVEQALELVRDLNVYPLIADYVGIAKLSGGFLTGLSGISNEKPIEATCSENEIKVHVSLTMPHARTSYYWGAPSLNYAGSVWCSAGDVKLDMTATITISDVALPTVRVNEVKLKDMSNFHYNSEGPEVFYSFGEGRQITFFKSMFTNVLENVLNEVIARYLRLLLTDSWYKTQLYTRTSNYSKLNNSDEFWSAVGGPAHSIMRRQIRNKRDGQNPYFGSNPMHGPSTQFGSSPPFGSPSQYGAFSQYGSPSRYGSPPQYGPPSRFGSSQFGSPSRYGPTSKEYKYAPDPSDIIPMPEMPEMPPMPELPLFGLGNSEIFPPEIPMADILRMPQFRSAGGAYEPNQPYQPYKPYQSNNPYRLSQMEERETFPGSLYRSNPADGYAPYDNPDLSYRFHNLGKSAAGYGPYPCYQSQNPYGYRSSQVEEEEASPGSFYRSSLADGYAPYGNPDLSYRFHNLGKSAAGYGPYPCYQSQNPYHYRSSQVEEKEDFPGSFYRSSPADA